MGRCLIFQALHFILCRAVSGSRLTKELRALRLLHSDALRDDPRNHTIPVLEFIEFNGQVFAVMPRRVLTTTFSLTSSDFH